MRSEVDATSHKLDTMSRASFSFHCIGRALSLHKQTLDAVHLQKYACRQLHLTAPLNRNGFRFVPKEFAYEKLKEKDGNFTEEGFMKGAKLALCTISDVMSRGDFVDMRQLVEAAEVDRIEAIYKTLSAAKRDWLRVMSPDVLQVYVTPSACLFDETQQFIKIPVYLAGFHERKPESFYFANYFAAFYMFHCSLAHANDDFSVSDLTHRQYVVFRVV